MKRTILVLGALCLGVSLGAQVAHDPNDQLYQDIDLWAVRGYIRRPLPVARPYPAQTLEALLEEAAANGPAADAALARSYQASLRGFHGGLTGSVQGQDGDASLVGAPSINGGFRLKDWLTGSIAFYVYGSTKDLGNELAVPGAYNPFPDFTSDTASIGPFNLFMDWTSSLAVGSESLYFQSGITRSSFGPFYDNGVVIGPQAAKAANFSLHYQAGRWGYDILWLELVASTAWGANRYPDKHLVSHVLSFRPAASLECAFFQSMVWGGRFDPTYLVPLSDLFAAGALADNADNSFMGLHARWYAAPGLQALGQVYVDDAHLNNIMRFNFNTKLKLAAEAGLVWAPEGGLLKSLKGDYTAVLPYMYTHIRDLDETTYNDRYPSQEGFTGEQGAYQDYSHMGLGLGASLDPNSDRVSLRAAFKPLGPIDISLLGYFTRHGNASEDRVAAGLMDGTYHDGSLFDDGNNDGAWGEVGVWGEGEEGNYDNNYSELHFLTQDTLETKLAAGFTVAWRLPIPPAFGALSLSASYLAEYAWNRGLTPGNDTLVHYWSAGGTYRY